MSDSAVWTVTEPEIMEMPGTLDADTAPVIEEDARLCIQSGGRGLILDCYAVETLTGAGLRAMLSLAREMEKVNGRLAVCNLQGQPHEIFETCNFARVIPSFGTQDEAVARLAA